MKEIIKEIIRPCYRFIVLLSKLNVLKTIYVNFKCFPFSIAIKLPMYIYGAAKIHSLSGTVRINAPIQSGMIKIGYRWWDLFPSSFLPTQLWISGLLTFEGKCIVSGGVGLFVQEQNASICIGSNVRIGGGTMVKSMDQLLIGDNTSITGNCTIMNSEMHYVKNINAGLINKNRGKIIIGHHCWINSGSIITKGAVIPGYSIVARNSFVNKDFSVEGNNVFIVGSPAKAKPIKVQRIFSIEKEIELDLFFKENPSSSFYDDGIGLCNEDINFKML